MTLLSVAAPEDWRLAPDLSGLDYATWCRDIVAATPTSTPGVAALARELAQLPQLAKQIDRLDALWMLVVTTGQRWAGIRGAGCWTLRPISGLDSITSLLDVRPTPLDERLVDRVIDRVVVGGRSMVRCRDIVAQGFESKGAKTLQQRFTGVLRDEQREASVWLEMSSPDLLRLGNLHDICTQALASVEIKDQFPE